MGFDRHLIGARVAELAGEGVYVGTSSWKYPGWRGLLYDEARYIYRGKFAESRFEKHCLAEYAEVFKTVCVDAAYYKFPDEKYLRGMAGQVPDDFLFALKVTDEITIKRFTNLPRFGVRAGTTNEHFLDAELFKNNFLKPCESIQTKVGLLMFEFSRFYPSDYQHGREFVADLDRFLGALPRGLPYGVELRNREWLRSEYFDCLAHHSVTHIFNSWGAMPAVSEQMAIPGSFTNPDLTAARFLLKPGRRFEQAVKMFQPYKGTKEVNEEARAAGRKLVGQRSGRGVDSKILIYVNNRLEGNALETIAAMVS